MSTDYNVIVFFVDGAVVKRTGDVTFDCCSNVLDDMHQVEEGKICFPLRPGALKEFVSQASVRKTICFEYK